MAARRFHLVFQCRQGDRRCGLRHVREHGIRCWIAPRDVPAGSEWAEAIIDAIEHAIVMVLIFSTHSNESRQVRREIELAVSRGLTIMPIRSKARADQVDGQLHGGRALDGRTDATAGTAFQADGRLDHAFTARQGEGCNGTAAQAESQGETNAAIGARGRSIDARCGAAALRSRSSNHRGRTARRGRGCDAKARRTDQGSRRRPDAAQAGDDPPHYGAQPLRDAGRREQALAAFDEVVRRYRKAPDHVLDTRVAMALVDRGNPLNRLGRPKEALASYDELATLFGSSTDRA